MYALIYRRAPVFTSRVLCSRYSTSSDNFHPYFAPGKSETGLYGFEILKTAKGFRRFVDEAIERTGELISNISQVSSSMEIIRAMDEISDTVCSVMDSAELCRNTHPDREYAEEANRASMRIYEYLHFLNTNKILYDAVRKAENEGIFLTEESRRAAHNLKQDFEKGGILLSESKLDQVNQLNIKIAQLGREFSENIAIDPGSVDVFPAARIPKHIRHLLEPIHDTTVPFRSRDKDKVKGFRIITDPNTLSSILRWVPDDEVRKKSYISGNSSPRANLEVLDKLIAARHQLAQVMGYNTYADFAIHPNLAASPVVVMSLLQDLTNIVRPKADDEFKKIKDFKRKICNECSADLEAWDEAYFTGIMKSSTYDLDSSVVASYFPLSQCIEGLKILVKSLFGATFHHIPLTFGESWHPDILKMSLHHPEEGDLGYLYLDLYSRPGKYPGCAHFAIKGGRRLSGMNYQLPVVALVCNFSGSSRSSTARLNHWELETLFHEFGHALHSLLSRTDYQHFSGTRMVLDLAETPSNLFEYYAWDYRVLRTFAKHYSTGEVIPEKLVQSMNDSKNIFYSVIDQTLFGKQPLTPNDTISLVADLKRQYTCWKHVEGTHWHSRFTHLINYGAGYYSYLYAKCFASTIWQTICREDPLSLATGTAIRTKFLQHGGAKDPSDLLKDFVGDSILRHHNGGIIPDISSLCKEMNL